MNIVKFPGFNLEFKFSKIAFSVFGINIYKYAVCIVLGIIVGLFLCKISKEKYENDYNFVLETLITSLIPAIIGARLYFVLFNYNYYSKNILEIFDLRKGGLAIYGGIIFGLITAIIKCKKSKKDILNFFDYIVPFVAIAQSIGRFGNFFNIEAYGCQTNFILRMGIYIENQYIEVHPTFLYESFCTLIIFFILRIIQKNRKFKGQITLLYFMLYSFIRIFIEGIRTDSLMFFNCRISQILSIIIFFVSFFVLLSKEIKCRKMSTEN